MIGELTTHIWQSTIFAIAAGLLTLAFRRNRAKVRFWLWLSASLKFFIPFALLMNLGSHIQWAPAAQRITTPAMSIALEFVAQPFPVASVPAVPRGTDWIPAALIGLWTCGFVVISLTRLKLWLGVRAAVRASTLLEIPAAVGIRSAPGLLEPGVVGLLKPVLLLPEGIMDSLTPSQLEAVLAHELCHVRRRDNLFASIHMVVEAIFWFHPLVWWIGARLLEERERACDEDVLSSGSQPRVYADAILNVCKLYVKSPLVCVSGVSGADIGKRIEKIMGQHALKNLDATRKLLLASAGVVAIALPIAAGLVVAPRIGAQSADADQRFEVASVKLSPSCAGGPGFLGGGRGRVSPGRLTEECAHLRQVIQQAFGNGPLWREQVLGGPGWVDSDVYAIVAKAKENTPIEQMTGSMMRSLLEERFRLKIHRETKEVPVYALTVAKGGPKLQLTNEGSCIPQDQYQPQTMPPPGQLPKPLPAVCGGQRVGPNGIDMAGVTIAKLCAQLSMRMDRDVVDKTGIAGVFDIHLGLSPDDLIPTMMKAIMSGDSAAPAPSADPPVSSIFDAVQKVGLKLESAKGSAELLVIDHIERPSEN